MRRLLAPILLAAALVGAVAPSASAESCYGAQEYAYACVEGAGATPGEIPVGACLFTGGSQCTPYYVDVPWVWLDVPRNPSVCVYGDCSLDDPVMAAVRCATDPRCGGT